jgi:hypothetical protein
VQFCLVEELSLPDIFDSPFLGTAAVLTGLQYPDLFPLLFLCFVK